ncbi:LysR substrate-binding domain-containing protein [Halomonas marinisediminis]|uniref:LysR substrate-binding domain-containing protein n=1 Tax=Halomonas marinisediminis TaxID=2546095 RepID=A0ABY2D8J7_9GAMM|nr:hypothetical protein E0702_06395 [Halomonas marinisediminis]
MSSRSWLAVWVVNRSSTSFRYEVVPAGPGVSALPSLSFRRISSEGLDWRPLIAPRVPRTLGVITHSRTLLSTAASAMLDLVRAHAPAFKL